MRPTTQQTQLFEDICAKNLNEITRKDFERLTPAQQQRIFELRKLDNVLLFAKTPEEIKDGFASIKWGSISNSALKVLMSGWEPHWEAYPFDWLSLKSKGKVSFDRHYFNWSKLPEPNWVVDHIIGSTSGVWARGGLPRFTPDFINFLTKKGLSGNTRVSSTAFGGLPSDLKFTDILIAHNRFLGAPEWEGVIKNTTWTTSLECEDTLFAVSSVATPNTISQYESLFKRFSDHPINWARSYVVCDGHNPQDVRSLDLGVVLCATAIKTNTIKGPSVREWDKTRKNWKSWVAQAAQHISHLPTDQQIEAWKTVWGLSCGRLSNAFRDNPNLINHFAGLVESAPENVKHTVVSFAASQIIRHHREWEHIIKNLVLNARTNDAGCLGMDVLQTIQTNIHKLMSPAGNQAIGVDLRKKLEGLRPYFSSQGEEVLAACLEGLKAVKNAQQAQEWQQSFSLHVQLKPELMSAAPHASSRKL